MPPRPRATQPRRGRSPTARAFLFSDLRDYTSYVEAKGDAAAARLLREYRTLVRREVARHAGAEVKTEGDSFYVVFDGASSALECAVSILRAAHAQNLRDPSVPLRIGVGLHAGETVAYDDQFVGSAVNIASRLAGKSGAMELLISDTLRGLVRTSQALPMTDRGPLELKGVAEPIRAWQVDWRDPASEPEIAAPAVIASAPAPASAVGQFLCPVVVGRAAETARLGEALAAAVGGAGQSIVLGGEAGVGKTKFVREAQTRAAAAGARTLLGLTRQSDGALPYAPFISAIRSGFHGLERDQLGRVLQRSAPDLAELFPELGRIDRPGPPTGLERHRLTVAFQHLFRAFAREAPVLLVLEDLHWADESSLELLQHLARELRDARVLILATYRSDEMHRRHPFLKALSELQRERLVIDIALTRLTPEETRELIRAAFAPTDPNITVSDEFRDAIYARSEGNPFFTEELLKALVESGGVFWQGAAGWGRKPIAELKIPGTIREAVRARVELLSPAARETLSAAAVIGQRFAFDVLRDVTGADERGLEAQISEFVEQQLVADATDSDDEYSFRHALTREVVYDDLLTRERRRLHGGVAEALMRHPAPPALLAHHLLAAGEGARAVPVLLEAAAQASRADAPREAVAHYERAFEVGVPEDQQAALLEKLAEAYHLFDEVRSLKAATESAEAYRQLGDRRGTSRALQLASRDLWLRADHGRARAVAAEAVEVLDGEECVELARALAHVAGLKMLEGRNDDAIEVADRAVALGERFDDRWALSNALTSKGSALLGRDVAAGFELLDRGRRIAIAAGLTASALRAWNNQLIPAYLLSWPPERRLAFVQEGLAWGRARGVERTTLQWLINFEVYFLGDLARWDEALHEVEQIVHPTLSWPIRIWLKLGRGGPEAVQLEAAAMAKTAEDQPEPQSFVPLTGIAATVLALAGDQVAARALGERLVRRCADSEPVRSMASGPWHVVTLGLALLIESDELLAVVGAMTEAPSERFRLWRQAGFEAAHAVHAGDLAAAGRALGRYGDRGREHDGSDHNATYLTVFAARRAGRAVAAVPEWAEPLRRARAFATNAGATWWLDQLPEPIP
jgi:class 3 adenylate cyclase/tetratricopeptide (TPR) repeat protein